MLEALKHCTDEAETVSHIFEICGELYNLFEQFKKDDLGDSVIFVLNFLQKHNSMPRPIHLLNNKQPKCMERSNYFRDLGNKQFAKKHVNTLHFYNIALLTAPPKSLSLKLAYANRSALFFKLEKYTACLADIDTCLSLGYPSELVPKLIKRRNECTPKQRHEQSNSRVREMCANYLKLSSKRNRTIPCYSASVTIREDGSRQTVVAAVDISAGEVISVETAFTAISKDSDSLICCYYCLSFTENLIPCDACCFVLFCNDECKEKCWQEYHSIECQIMMIIQPMPPIFRMSLKTVLKARSSCSSWDELIQKVDEMDISDHNNVSAQYTHLCKRPKFVQNPRYGRSFNMSIYAAMVVHALSEIPFFMSNKPNEKERIMHFLANQIMFHCVRGKSISISEFPLSYDGLDSDLRAAAGFFPFIEKCRHSCNANVRAVGLNNKITLISLTPIMKGAEILVSYGNHFLERDTASRRRQLYERYAFVCKCEACANNWSRRQYVEPNELTMLQQQLIRQHNPTSIMLYINGRSEEAAIKYYNDGSLQRSTHIQTLFEFLPRHDNMPWVISVQLY